MDPDGKNQRQITRFNNISTYPTVSPDGSKIAFTSWVKGQPAIFVFSVDPVRDLRYYNQVASVNQTGSFTPDGKQIVYASSAGTGRCCRIFAANLDGTGFRPISSSSSIEVEPKVNPKTCLLYTSFDFAVLAEGFAEVDGLVGFAVGGWPACAGYMHVHIITHYNSINNILEYIYLK